MSFELSLLTGGQLAVRKTVDEIMESNGVSSRFGLTLTEVQAAALVKTRSESLQDSGRIEFGSGIISKLIYAFCDSPYINAASYESTLHELIGLFYYYKNETRDVIGDDELIAYMKKSFDGVCCGSLELLSGRELDRLARCLDGDRTFDPDEQIDDPEDE